MIYLDNISGTPIHPEVRLTMIKHLENGLGNPISQHKVGDEAADVLEASRKEVAALINAKPEEVIFTSGGTESVNHCIKGVAFANGDKGKHIVTSNIEHQSVLRALRFLMRGGYHVTSLPVDEHGIVDPEEVKKAITDETILVTIMHANNEIGTVEPIAEIGSICRERGVLFHSDAVASAGVIPVDVEALNVDLLSIAANQFYGPAGIGATYIRPETTIVPLLDGGIQENSMRGGAQNMLGIVGMGKAAELARVEMSSRVEHLNQIRKTFIEKVNAIDEILLNGHPTRCLPGLISVSVKYVEGESLVLLLDGEDICVSTRSACATGSLRASHVLVSIGRDYTWTQGTVIFSFGSENTMDEADAAFAAFKKSIDFLRSMSPFYQEKK